MTPSPPESTAIALRAHLRSSRVVAILRAAAPDRLEAVAAVLVTAGLGTVELPLTTPGALDVLARLRAGDDPRLVLGAGTVLSAAAARDAIAAGATYLVTPTLEPDVLEAATAAGVPVILGAYSPTEILRAHRLGAAAVKVFPAATAGGPAYLRALREPLPDLALVPTGGVGVDDVPAYLQAGALAVGMGGQLVGDALRGGDLEALRERAEHLRALVRDVSA